MAHQVPGRTRPTLESLSFLPRPFAAFIIANIANLTDDKLWWAYPELNTRVTFTLTNPVTNQAFFTGDSETTYWLSKWMDDDSYEQYQSNQRNHTPGSPADYLLDYSINGMDFPRWWWSLSSNVRWQTFPSPLRSAAAC
jgi:hypothetical protein